MLVLVLRDGRDGSQGHLLLILVTHSGLLLGPLNLVDAIVQTVLKGLTDLDQKRRNIMKIFQAGCVGGHCDVGSVKSFIKGPIFAVE